MWGNAQVLSPPFFFPFALFLWDANYPHVHPPDIVPKCRELFSIFCFLSNYSLRFTWGNLYWPVSKFTDYFFGCVESTDVSTGVIFHLYHLFFISSISTWLFCVSTITLLKFFTCSPHWNFSVRAFILLILVILNYLSDGSNVGLHISIVILFGIFFFFLVKPCIMQDWVVPWL